MTLSKKVIIGIALGIGFIFSAIVLGLLPVYNRKYRSSTQVTVVTSTNERITIPKGIFVPATTTINNNPTFLSTASVKTMPTKVAIITNTKVYTTFEGTISKFIFFKEKKLYNFILR